MMRWSIIIIFLLPSGLRAQTVVISGMVQTDENQTLPLAHIIVLPDSVTTVADDQGGFIARVKAGEKGLIVSYTGYETLTTTVLVLHDTALRFFLTSRTEQLNEVVVTADADLQQELFESTRAGANVLSGSDVSAIPVLGGEADPIKVLQLMPGTIRGIDGSSDLFVRGGAADQNLVLLDGTTIYNTSHLFGFVSVFNPDILASVESINGGFPAEYGGRLSSILDVKTNSKIADATHIAGNAGLLASRLYVEQPIIKDKVSLWVAGRRTYADQVVKLLGQELPYYFYDINAKVLVRPSDRDDIAVSLYRGDDRLDIFRDRNNDGNGATTAYDAANSSQSIQWTRVFHGKWYATIVASHTSFRYDIKNSFEENSLQAYSDIRDHGAKLMVGTNEFRNNGSILFGLDWTHHNVSPSIINSAGTISELLSSSASPARKADEASLFARYQWQWKDGWLINAGLRASMAFVKNKKYMVPEPRLSARYAISATQALKLSYSRMAQYMQRISYSAVTSPTDIWYPVTNTLKPQTSHQFSVAWQRTYPANRTFVSLETYYKAMDKLTGLEEGTNLFVNADFEPRLLQGKGRAFGFEVLLRKEAGRLTGWISYTLSWSNRQFDALNNGSWFRARYDRRHNGAIVLQYALHNRWSLSMVWEYITGSRFTPVIGQYIVTAPTSTGVDLLPVYAPVNSVKLTNSHRLDAGIKFRNRPGSRFRYEWFAGVYNVYNRTNPVGITIQTNETDGSLRYIQPGLFGLLPFISYGFKF